MAKIRKYGWLIKIISAALLFAIALYLELGNGEAIIVTFVGGVIVIFGLIRLIPITKTERNDIFKMINIIEITVNILVGILLIVMIMIDNPDVQLFAKEKLGYFLGGVLLIRGLIHSYGTSANLEKDDLPTYISTMVFIILGTYMIAVEEISATTIIHIIFGVAIVGGGYLVYDGGKGYKAYRMTKVNQKMVDESEKVKKEKVKKEKTVEDPKPVIQEEITEEERDRPTVN